MGSSCSGILVFPHLISLGSSWKVKGGRKKGYTEDVSAIFVARWKQTREDGGKEKQEENSWEVWWGVSVSLAAFSCPRIETNPAQNECLGSAALGGDAGHETEAAGAWKTCKIILQQKRKKNCETPMTDGKTDCFFFQNFILDIWLFATTLANADQNEGKVHLMFYLL